ncbi:MAG: hypothetical protein IAE80_12385 [Anaerolinea sp.]|nr:hypothetical protein [Anaerolinea sp.]
MIDRINGTSVGDFSNQTELRIYTGLKRLIGDDLAEFYRDACHLMNNPNQFRTTTHLISHLLREVEGTLVKVLANIANYVDKSDTDEGRHQRLQLAILEFLRIEGEEQSRIAREWSNLNFSGKAHRSSHTYRRLDSDFHTSWIKYQEILDVLLLRLEEKYLSAYRPLDELLAKPEPTKDDVSELENEVATDRLRIAYFFGNANSSWLRIRKFKDHFFRYPPESIEGYFYPWAATKYLVKWAESRPNDVFEVALQIPDTSNPLVFEDLCDVATRLPLEYALRLVPRLKVLLSLVKNPDPFSITALLSRLATQGNCVETVQLLGDILTIAPVEENEDETKRASYRKISSKIDGWNYQRILETILPQLAQHNCTEVVELLLQLLNTALEIEYPLNASSLDYDFWRQRIPYADSEGRQQIHDLLVTALYNYMLSLVKQGVDLDEWLEKLGTPKRKIVTRLVLQLIAAFPTVSSQTLSSYLVSHANFAAWTNEYFAALHQHYPKLSPNERDAILSWIDELAVSFPDYEPEQIRYRQGQAIAYIADFAPQAWKERYKELQAEFGEIAPVNQFFPVGAFFVGPTSPLSENEMRALPVQDVIEFLRTWEPSGEFMSPSPEGLGRTLTKVVYDSPADYEKCAMSFSQLHATYVRSYLTAFHDACRDDKPFEWESLLELCNWVTHLPIESESEKVTDEDTDPDWSWTRGTIDNLLEIGFQKSAVPFNLRDRTWQILQILVEDPRPAPSEEAFYQRSDSMSLYEGSLNTNRGKAFHALMQYALWCRRAVMHETEAGTKNYLAFMPEVTAVLDAHLANDHSLIVRSVYGWYFPWIYFLDRDWAVQNTDHIFPTDPESSDAFRAAWHAYLSNGRIFVELYPVLCRQYLHAIQNIDNTGKELGSDDPDLRLAEHILIMYIGQVVELDDDVIQTFFARATDEILASAIGYIGGQLSTLSPEQNERVKRMWEYRVEVATANPTDHQREMAAFGWWLTTPNSLDIDWKLEQASSALHVVSVLEPTHLVIKWIAENVAANPRLVAQCLSINVLNGEVWETRLGFDEIRAAIVAIAESSDKQAKIITSSMINKLSARGDLRFADLDKLLRNTRN